MIYDSVVSLLINSSSRSSSEKANEKQKQRKTLLTDFNPYFLHAKKHHTRDVVLAIRIRKRMH